MEQSMMAMLRRMFTRRDKKVIGVLLIASILVSMVETVSISALMLFISLSTNFDLALSNRYFNKLYRVCGCGQPSHLVIIFGLGLIAFYLFRLLLNGLHIYYMNKFAQMRQYYFSNRLFSRYLSYHYKDIIDKDSATISQIIFSYTAALTLIISALLMIFSEIFTVLCIYGMLFYVNWKMTLVLSAMLLIKVGVVITLFSKRISSAGQQSSYYNVLASKIFNESYWNYKFLKLISSDQSLRERFDDTRYKFAQANTVNALWQGLPRFLLETIGFLVLIAIIIYVVFRYNTATFALPMISMYALAFYRFMPSVNRIVMGYNQIIFNKNVLDPLHEYLETEYEALGEKQISFNHSIELKNVSFAYKNGSEVLHDASITLTKGLRVGFVGQSGAGKSTVADIIMGFFKPDQGQLLVDGVPVTHDNVKHWRQKIGYIPQSIFLVSGTVAENVCCGRPYDAVQVIDVLKRAQIYDFVMTKDGINTMIGEGGINMSGGQKQRIAIARALYGNPEILVLDEATSALDTATEAEIMNEVYSVHRDKTLIVIAHRLSTIERCDVVYNIEQKKIIPIIQTVTLQAFAQI